MAPHAMAPAWRSDIFLLHLLLGRYGRKATMMAGGACFLGGTALVTFAVHISMLVLGRVVLGFGVGFATQVNSPGGRAAGGAARGDDGSAPYACCNASNRRGRVPRPPGALYVAGSMLSVTHAAAAHPPHAPLCNSCKASSRQKPTSVRQVRHGKKGR